MRCDVSIFKISLINVARGIYRRLLWNESVRLRVTTFVFSHFGKFLSQSNRLLKNRQSKFGHVGEDRVYGAIDLPVMAENDEAISSGAIEVVGWAVSRSGIAKVEIYCDEKLVGEAHYGALRPDLVKAYAGFYDPGRGGYYWLLDTTKLAQGKHDLSVTIYCRSGEVADMHKEFRVSDANAVYQRWIAANEMTEAQREIMCAEIEADAEASLISIVAIGDASCNRERLTRTLNALNRQLYANWELLICTDNATVPKLKGLLDISAESRVTLATFVEPTWQEIFSRCNGSYIGVIDIGNVLDPRALWAVEKNMLATPDAGLIYADEDSLEDGKRIGPCFKPAWSPIYLQSYNYIGRPWFGNATLLRNSTIAGEPCNAATEHALLKRLGKLVDRVIHVPMVLCSRPANVLHTDRAVCDEDKYSDRTNQQKTSNSATPKVSVVIPTCLHNLDIIEKCFSSLLQHTDYPNLEVLVVKNNVADEQVAQRFLELWPFKVISWDGSFNWSGINNYGARSATGELLLFMNDDVEALNRDWLTNMVALATQESVGAVGAILMYPNQTIQHGGVFFINYGGGARHLFRFCNGTELQIAPMVRHNRESSAITGACLLARRGVFDLIQGFDETLPLVNNDTDFCLRLEEQGLASVVAAGATLVHHEGISRAGMSETEDNKRFWRRWRQRLESCDPYSNPNIDDHRDDWWLNQHSMANLQGRVSRGRPAVRPL